MGWHPCSASATQRRKAKMIELALLALVQMTQSRDIEFIAVYPPNGNVQSMELRGSGADGLSWSSGIAMQRESSQWSVNVTVDEEWDGIVEFKVVANGDTWEIGANGVTTTRVTTVVFHPFFFTTSGTISFIRDVPSIFFNNTRDVAVYFPPGYTENDLMPLSDLLIMTDGNNGS